MLQSNSKGPNSNILNKTSSNEINPKAEYNLSPFSLNQTASSFKEIPFQEKPKSIFTSAFTFDINKKVNSPFLMKSNFNAFTPVLDFNTNYNYNFKNFSNFNFIEKKHYINKINQFDNNMDKNDSINIEEKENGNILNLSAFKKMELNNKDNLSNSIFQNNKSFKKIKLIKKNKIKKKLNKIIINDSNNNILKNSENNGLRENNTTNTTNIAPKHKIFKSITFNIKNKNAENNTTEIAFLKKRRGRKTTSEIKGKRVHNASDYDNILRKIQVHFLTFIVYFTNDLVEAFLPNNKELRFKNLDYDLKKTVNHSYVEKLKNKTIGEILQFKASSKNRKFDSSINATTYKKICELNPILKKFFELSYLTVFNEYYYKNSKNFVYEGVNINISQRTKLFVDLVQKNFGAAEKMQQIALNNFIENKNQEKSPIFVINKKK